MNVGLLTAAAAGVVSFLSPCVLPLIPGYISFISGESLTELREGEPDRRVRLRVLLRSVWFVAGFSVVFVALGASATEVGSFLLERMDLFRQVAGALIVILGLHLTGLIRIPFLQYEKKVEVRKQPLSFFSAFLVGAAFAFGWTPCIGPILAGILALAATQETVGQGMTLLAVYSLGLGVPFLATSLGVQRFWKFFTAFKRYLRIVEVISGVLLMAIGALIFTDRFGVLSQYLTFFNRFAL